MFTWSHKSATSIQDLSFKVVYHTQHNNYYHINTCSITQQVLCNGKLTYHENGKKTEEEVKFEHTCPGSSFPKERHKVTSLLPNTLYTCSVVTLANKRQSEPHNTIQFKTQAGSMLGRIKYNNIICIFKFLCIMILL